MAGTLTSEEDVVGNRSMSTHIRLAPYRSRFRFRRFAAQTLLAGGQAFYAGVMAIGWEIIANSLGWTEDKQFPLAPAGPQILNACVIAGLGFLTGWLLARLLPSAARAGLWAWLPPTALLALAIGWNILGDHWSWHSVSAFYFWSYPARKIGPVGRDLFTYPTLSAIASSLGVMVRISRCWPTSKR